MVVENLATFKVYKVKDGPYQDEKGGMWWLSCWVEDCDPKEDLDEIPFTEESLLEVDLGCAMFDEDIPFSTFTNAYNFKKHLESSEEPVLIKFRFGEDIKYDK
jgi:hypothetical protein